MSSWGNESNRTARRCCLRTGPGSSQSGRPSDAQPPAKTAAATKSATGEARRGEGMVTDAVPGPGGGRETLEAALGQPKGYFQPIFKPVGATCAVWLEAKPSMGRGYPCHLAGRSLQASCLPVARWNPRFAILAALGFQRRRDSTGNPSLRPARSGGFLTRRPESPFASCHGRITRRSRVAGSAVSSWAPAEAGRSRQAPGPSAGSDQRVGR